MTHITKEGLLQALNDWCEKYPTAAGLPVAALIAKWRWQHITVSGKKFTDYDTGYVHAAVELEQLMLAATSVSAQESKPVAWFPHYWKKEFESSECCMSNVEKQADDDVALYLHPAPSVSAHPETCPHCGDKIDDREEWLSHYCARISTSVSAQDASPKDGWQPIETAPKDGSRIDLWLKSYIYLADGDKQVAVEFRVADAAWNDGWTNPDGNSLELEGFEPYEFSHWMQQPEPPHD